MTIGPNDLSDSLRRLDAQQSAARTYVANLTPDQRSNVVSLAATYPHLGPATVPLGASGITPDSSVARKVAQARVSQQQKQTEAGRETTGGVFGRIWQHTKGAVADSLHSARAAARQVTKYATVGMAAPYEFTEGTFRSGLGSLQEGDYRGALAPFGAVGLLTSGKAGEAAKQTTVVSGIQEAHRKGVLLDPAKWDTVSGDGWFIGPQSAAGQRQARQARAQGLIDGRALTPGRTIAHLLPLEPGSGAYKVVSGLVDMTSALALDPTTYIGGGIAKGARARSVIARGPMKEYETARRLPAGALPTPEGEETVRLYRGMKEPLDPSRIEPQGARFTTQLDYAQQYAGDDGFMYSIDVPKSKMPTTPMGEALGQGPLPHTYLTAEEAQQARLIRAPREHHAQNAGLVDGIRRTVLPEKAIRWLDSEEAGSTIRLIAQEKDLRRLWRNTGKKLDVDTYVRLLDADSEVDVKNILVDAIERGSVREKMTYRVKRLTPPRIAEMMPGSKIDLEDLDDALEQLDRFGRNARLPHAVMTRHLEDFARAASDGERFKVVEAVGSQIQSVMLHNGFTASEARRWTRFWRDAHHDARKYFVDATGDNAHIPGVMIGGDMKPLAQPHLSTELIDRHIPLPNARDIRAATAKTRAARALQRNGLYRGGRDVADWVTSDLFKVFTLALRPAWTVRVVGEEQVRMAAAGMASAFHHPLSYIAWLAGEDTTKLGRIAGKIPGIEARGGVDVLGRSFLDDVLQRNTEFRQGMNIGSAGWRNRDFIHARGWITYQRHEEPYIDSWLDELSQLATAPEANQVARNMDNLDAVKAAWWDGDPALSSIRRQMAAALPDAGYDTRAGSDAFIESVADRIRIKTGGHPDLIQAVAHGKIGGHTPLMLGPQSNAKAKALLRELEQQEIGPGVVKGPLRATMKDPHGMAGAAQLYDRVAEAMFNALGAVPTNKLSRSPVFRQQYWARAEELARLLPRSERVTLARAGQRAGLDGATLRRLRSIAREPSPAREDMISLADVDGISKHYALHQTRDLLYSLHEKAQVADAVRVLVPFGEAWREVMTRWAKLGTENPLVAYRAGQVLTHGESGEGRDGLLFHPDPLTGEEMISIPGSEWITQKLVGVPVGEEMPLQGLNMFGQILPGVGPVVTLPAGKLLPEDPGWDWARDAIMPYGETDTSSGVVESFLPAYLKKVLTTVGHGTEQNKRQLASVTRDTMAYLASTGDYDLTSPDGQDELIQDARLRAKAIYLIRGLSQSTLPSSPVQRFSVRDKDGRLMTMFKLAEDYRQMQEEDYRTATERFLDKYGEDAILATISKSTGPVSPTDRVNRLARSNPSVARMFPTTFGYFAPGGEVDPGEIERQIRQGTRTLIGPEKAVAAANIRIASSIYSRAQEKVGTTVSAEERSWLREVKAKLQEDYPGYTGGFDTGQETASVQELLRAGKNPVLRRTQAGEALGIYRQARERAMQAAAAGGHGWPSSSKDMAGWNTWLRTVGERLVADHPDFGEMFDRVLSRELPAEEEK